MTETTRPSGKRRLVISGGALLAAAALVTAAAFTDLANINLFGNTDKEGIGKKTFALHTQQQAAEGTTGVLGDGDGAWISASSNAGIDWVLPNGTDLSPGDDSSVIIPLKNVKKTGTNGAPIKLTFNIGTVPGKTDDTDLKDHVKYDVSWATVDSTTGAIGATYTPVATDVSAADAETSANLVASLATDTAIVVKVTLKIDAAAPASTENKTVFPRFQVNAEVA